MQLVAREKRRIIIALVCALTVLAAAQPAGARPRAAKAGGTLKIIGSADVSNFDPLSDYGVIGTAFTRMFARQLVSYPDDADFTKASTIAADVAKEVPTRANGGIANGGRTYTFHLRPDVMWDTHPARAVTAQDFVRGFAMLCNPVSPAGAPSYYTTTITGMASYCTAFSKVKPTIPAIAAFVKSHHVAGISAPDATTLVIKLLKPASDFLNIVAMGFDSARPVEYEAYLPDGAPFRQHSISNGPYSVVKYSAGKEIDLDRNPAWKASSDPLRKAYVDHIQIIEGVTNESAQQQIEAGTADLDWDAVVPTAALPRLIAAKDPRLTLAPTGRVFGTLNYLAMNLYTGPMKNLVLRQAVATAINKNVLVKLLGGPKLNTVAKQLLSPGGVGATAFDPFPANTGNGNPAAARKLIAKAGLTSKPTIKILYPTQDPLIKVSEAIQASLKLAGFDAKLVASSPSDYFGKYLSSQDSAKRGTWDVTPVGWFPDWFGNNGRSILQPLLTSPGDNSPNYGGYDSRAVNGFIAQALQAETQDEAAAAWGKADEQALRDVADIPLAFGKLATIRSSRVHGCHVLSLSLNCDPTNVSLG